MKTFSEIIANWPSLNALADDLDVMPNTVAVWKHRGRIPSRYWAALTATQTAKHHGVSLEVMAAIAAKRG